MAGARKQRAQRAKKEERSSQATSDSSKQAKSGERSTPTSVPRLDGNRDPIGPSHPIVNNRRLELDTSMYDLNNQEKSGYTPPLRQGYSNLGTPLKDIGLNMFRTDLDQVANIKIFQYDFFYALHSSKIAPSRQAENKTGLSKKLWFSREVQAMLPPNAIFDGNRLAWGTREIGEGKELKTTVDLNDYEKAEAKAMGTTARKPPGGDPKNNVFNVFVKQTKRIDFASLFQYMRKSDNVHISPDNSIIEALNFLDHVLRQGPSENLVPIKRSFFSRPNNPYMLKAYLEAWKGCFATLKMTNGVRPGDPCMALNIDVSNGCFWAPMTLTHAVQKVLDINTPEEFGSKFRQAIVNKKGWLDSEMKANFNKFRKLAVWVKPRGRKGHDGYQPMKQQIIDFIPGDTPSSHVFPWNDDRNPYKEEDSYISVAEYLEIKYRMKDYNPSLPVVCTTRGGAFPIQWFKIVDAQRYPFKLDEKETSEMMKFAVQYPGRRWDQTLEAIDKLQWQNDKYLKHYGIKVAPKRTEVSARLLPAPDLQFAGSGPSSQIKGAAAGSGRWKVEGKKFRATGPPLKRWAIIWQTDINGKNNISEPEVRHFVSQLMAIWKSHGQPIPANPLIFKNDGTDSPGDQITAAWNAAGKYFDVPADFFMFILPWRDQTQYNQMKKSMDCRMGTPSQMVLVPHVKKCAPQYISNVCLKMNAKIGGYTNAALLPQIAMSSIAKGYADKKPRLLGRRDVMIIGADVSHAAPGSSMPSTAALTASMDPEMTRYACVCNTNGFRDEIVRRENIARLKPFIRQWASNNGSGNPPKIIIYLRDGVSDAECREVVAHEVGALKEDIDEMCKEGALRKDLVPKVLCCIVSKRHHVRFFPKAGDKNGNPKPGTLVEFGACHPFHDDWYLCAHSAIKGTARPVHYKLVYNEVKDLRTEELQALLYSHSYQYVRSTTPVSLHPAIYYAHLASVRSKAHEKKPSEAGSRVKAVWNAELDKRIARKQENEELRRKRQKPKWSREEVRTDTETMKSLNLPGVPKNWTPEQGEPVETEQERAGKDLMPLWSKNSTRFPWSMWFV